MVMTHPSPARLDLRGAGGALAPRRTAQSRMKVLFTGPGGFGVQLLRLAGNRFCPKMLRSRQVRETVDRALSAATMSLQALCQSAAA
jgi:hypothetical protein